MNVILEMKLCADAFGTLYLEITRTNIDTQDETKASYEVYGWPGRPERILDLFKAFSGYKNPLAVFVG